MHFGNSEWQSYLEQRQGNKNKLATACQDLNLPMLFRIIKTCSSTFSPMPPTKTFSLSGGHSESTANPSLAHPAYHAQDPSQKPGWPNQKPLLSLAFHSHVSMPSGRSTLRINWKPHKALLWLLSARETLERDGQWVTSQGCFLGLPEKQELPNSSHLFLNRSNTPRRGGGRKHRDLKPSYTWLLLHHGFCNNRTSDKKKRPAKADSGWGITSLESRGPKTLTVAKHLSQRPDICLLKWTGTGRQLNKSH